MQSRQLEGTLADREAALDFVRHSPPSPPEFVLRANFLRRADATVGTKADLRAGAGARVPPTAPVSPSPALLPPGSAGVGERRALEGLPVARHARIAGLGQRLHQRAASFSFSAA